MATYNFTIRLTSDAEPGTGLGGETVNELVPRDHRGRPVINASHVKGLMRWELLQIVQRLNWDERLTAYVFGCEDHIAAALHLTDAQLASPAEAETFFVTRTAVEETGVAQDKSLRTSEAIPTGALFAGRVHAKTRPHSALDLAWRLALLSIPAIGGNRNRGCGACVVDIEGEDRSPSQLLSSLSEALQDPAWEDEAITGRAIQVPSGHQEAILGGQSVILRFVFQAITPICCPEIADKTNVLASGFSIPASAIQGAILHRLNCDNPSLAGETFDSPLFRAWPLQPCWLQRRDDETPPDRLPLAIRVSLTHRVAKLSAPTGYREGHFQDEAIQPYDWRKVAGGAPLKASDGVLLRDREGRVSLWRANDMPRVITAHGVHGESTEERNLFSVEAMAPMVWQGLATMPAEAAEQLIKSLQSDPIVPMGKSRSVRGLGELRAEIVEGVPEEWQTSANQERTVLVVQSPLLLPKRQPAPTAEAELRHLAKEWTGRCDLPADKIEQTWAKVNVLFGWSRHEKSGRLEARRVVMPGSVISFCEPLNNEILATALRIGVGEDGRRRGYGAVSVHPGKALDLYTSDPQVRSVPAAAEGQPQGATELVLRMRRSTDRLPSPSQIRAVQQQLANWATNDEEAGKREVLRYIKRQTERTSRIWFTWEPIYRQMSDLVKNYRPNVACQALEVLADLAAEER